MKICTKCKVNKEFKEFSSKGGDKLNSWCKVCHSIHTKEYKTNNTEYSNRKKLLKQARTLEIRQRVWSYLETNPCKDCGETDPVVLDFDHMRDKEFNISEATKLNYAWSRIENEISKCEVRCANCHRKKTAKERNFYKGLLKAPLV